MITRVLHILGKTILGYLLGTALFLGFTSFLYLLGFFNIIPLKSLNQLPVFKAAYVIVIYVCIIGGIVSIFKSWKKKNVLYQILRISKSKIIVAVMLAFICVISIHALGKGNHDLINPINQTLFTHQNIFLWFTYAFFVNIFISYPFSAALLAIFSSLKEKKKLNISHWVIVLMLILLSNPIVYMFGNIASVSYLYNINSDSIFYKNCGARVVDLQKGGPGEKAGIKRLDVITKIDGKVVVTPTDLTSFLNAKKDVKKVSLTTKLDEYSIMPYKDAKSGKLRLGITIDQSQCGPDFSD